MNANTIIAIAFQIKYGTKSDRKRDRNLFLYTTKFQESIFQKNKKEEIMKKIGTHGEGKQSEK